jgi:uncharacterized protein YggL (DUF469 family)
MIEKEFLKIIKTVAHIMTSETAAEYNAISMKNFIDLVIITNSLNFF